MRFRGMKLLGSDREKDNIAVRRCSFAGKESFQVLYGINQEKL